jgi:flavodoxin I
MDKILVVYWSGTGNTEIMAEKIRDGIESTGKSVDLKPVDLVKPSDVQKYEKIAFGCPSMGVEILEEDEFEPFFESVESYLSNKKVLLFGSFGWGNGEWMEAWVSRTESLGANLLDQGLMINSTPAAAEEEECFNRGVLFANF